MSIQTLVKNGKVSYLVTGPHEIGTRLAPALKLPDGSRVTIAVSGRNGEGRVTYQWYVDDSDGAEIGSGNDMFSAVNGDPDVEAVFASFGSFVAAWAETFRRDYSDNADLFPQSMQDWAESNSDDLSMLTAGPEG